MDRTPLIYIYIQYLCVCVWVNPYIWMYVNFTPFKTLWGELIKRASKTAGTILSKFDLFIKECMFFNLYNLYPYWRAVHIGINIDLHIKDIKPLTLYHASGILLIKPIQIVLINILIHFKSFLPFFGLSFRWNALYISLSNQYSLIHVKCLKLILQIHFIVLNVIYVVNTL